MVIKMHSPFSRIPSLFFAMSKRLTLGSNGELILETLEVDKGGQQGRGLDIGVKNQEADKVVERRDDNR